MDYGRDQLKYFLKNQIWAPTVWLSKKEERQQTINWLIIFWIIKRYSSYQAQKLLLDGGKES